MKKNIIFLIFILSHLSANANGINLSCAFDQNLCDDCPEYQTLFPLENFSENEGSLDIEADESEIKDQKYMLSGNVEVNSQNLYLSANDVEVSSADSSILATGNVRFQDESYLITSDYLSAGRDSDNLIATATNANYQDYSAGSRGANGFTKVIEKTPTSVLLTNSTYSLCPINKNDWLIDADEIELNLLKNRGRAENATVKFYGVPIFYTPKYSWVLSGRGSGFLTPDFSRYNEPNQKDSSFSLRVPYYFNLAPDRDFLLALNLMSSRNMVYEGKYRQLLAPKISTEHEDSIYSIEAKYLPEDKITGLKRWLVNFSEELDLSKQTHLSVKYNRVSDPMFFQEIARSDTDLKTLTSHLKVSYTDEENSLSGFVLTENEQIVNSGVPEYTRALEGSISKTFNKKTKSPISVDFVTTKFTHQNNTKETGNRTHADVEISRVLYPLKTSYPQIKPSASIAVTNYSLKNNPNINRTIFGSGLDINFTSFRRNNLFGYDVNHRITPLISYKYRAKKVQGDIPIFDTTDKYDDIITFSDLTSGERYTGLDRITNANDITLSLESSYRKIDSLKEDKDLLNLKIAQSYFSDNEVVSDSSTDNYETRKKYSDIAASVDLVVDNLTFSSKAQYNPDKSKIVKKENTISYNPSSRKFISLSFIDEGTKETEKLYGAYPITDSIHVFGGLDRTTSTGITNSETTGIAYESCCWAFRIAHFKDHKSGSSYNYSTGFELVLTGLGSTSSPLNGRIENNIPGYKANLR